MRRIITIVVIGSLLIFVALNFASRVNTKELKDAICTQMCNKTFKKSGIFGLFKNGKCMCYSYTEKRND